MNKEKNVDYYTNKDGLVVFTEAYHLKRGTCCGNKCLHCPYNHKNVPKVQEKKRLQKSKKLERIADKLLKQDDKNQNLKKYDIDRDLFNLF
jgi:2-iminoacetate synthase ThiH